MLEKHISHLRVIPAQNIDLQCVDFAVEDTPQA